MEPPSVINGSAALASAASEYADTWSATATSSQGASRNPPPRHDSGANPIAWTTPSSRPPTASARPARSSLFVTSSSTSFASSGRRRAARVVRLMIRPNDVSTTSAPCSWASLAIENAIDSLFNTPVTRIRLSWSSIGAAYVTRVSRLQRRIAVLAIRSLLALGAQSSQRRRQNAPRIRCGDHVVDVAALGRDIRVREPRLELLLQCELLATAVVVVDDAPQRASVEDLHRARRAHHRDLRRGPGTAPIVAEPLRVHDDVCAAVRLAQHDAQTRHGRIAVGIHELGTVSDHPAPLEILSGLEPGGVDERQQRDVERVAPLHEARRLLRRLDVERSGPLDRLVGDDADGVTVESAERGHDVGRVVCPQLEAAVLVEHVVDHVTNVVGRGCPCRDGRRGACAVAVDGVAARPRRWV